MVLKVKNVADNCILRTASPTRKNLSSDNTKRWFRQFHSSKAEAHGSTVDWLLCFWCAKCQRASNFKNVCPMSMECAQGTKELVCLLVGGARVQTHKCMPKRRPKLPRSRSLDLSHNLRKLASSFCHRWPTVSEDSWLIRQLAGLTADKSRVCKAATDPKRDVHVPPAGSTASIRRRSTSRVAGRIIFAAKTEWFFGDSKWQGEQEISGAPENTLNSKSCGVTCTIRLQTT